MKLKGNGDFFMMPLLPVQCLNSDLLEGKNIFTFSNIFFKLLKLYSYMKVQRKRFWKHNVQFFTFQMFNAILIALTSTLSLLGQITVITGVFRCVFNTHFKLSEK